MIYAIKLELVTGLMSICMVNNNNTYSGTNKVVIYLVVMGKNDDLAIKGRVKI